MSPEEIAKMIGIEKDLAETRLKLSHGHKTAAECHLQEVERLKALLSAAQAAKKDRAEEIAEKIVNEHEGKVLSPANAKNVIVAALRLMESETAAKYQPVMCKDRLPPVDRCVLALGRNHHGEELAEVVGVQSLRFEWPHGERFTPIAWLPIPELPAGGAK